ncbi:MAG TPA: TrkA family potassium uptake protein [Candidatus Babeliales bacterium]|nr:TrkA family potassium uptake protein [Candidatus Babeliales bacterium]
MKFCVIGLGRFGYQVATVLSENGMEVLAIDNNESIIASIRDSVAHAIVMDVTDEASLRSVGVDEIDTVIVAMGENSTQTILITALLKKHLKTPYVITRAIDDLNKEILSLVGADRVILPEQEIGIRLADNLSSPFVDVTRLAKNFSVTNVVAPDIFIGKNIEELNFFINYNIYCIGKKEEEKIIAIGPDYIIKELDKLIFAGPNKSLEKLAKL